MPKKKFTPGALSLPDEGLASLMKMNESKKEEWADTLDAIQKDATIAPAKEEKTPPRPKPERAQKPEGKKPKEKQPLIQKPEQPETKSVALNMRVKRSELAAWQKTAKDNGVSLTYLIEYVMNKFVEEASER